MVGHKICFYGEIWLIIPKISLSLLIWSTGVTHASHLFSVAWFSLDPESAHTDVIFSNNNLTATCRSFDHRIILGDVGFSKGIHYWEVTIDRYDCFTDPAIGIARFDVDKEIMLGKFKGCLGILLENSD